MTAENKRKSKFLYGIFVQVLSGRALNLLKLTPMNNGFEAWRRLVKEYEPDTPLHYAAMLRALMKPS
eukprot:16439165-Heterocapsa_arctica.AAC.1